MRKLLLIGVLVLAMAPTVAHASPDRPTIWQGHQIAHRMLDLYADGFDGNVIVGRCAARGRHSLVCVARMTGRRPDRLEVVATATPRAFVVLLRDAPTAR